MAKRGAPEVVVFHDPTRRARAGGKVAKFLVRVCVRECVQGYFFRCGDADICEEQVVIFLGVCVCVCVTVCECECVSVREKWEKS